MFAKIIATFNNREVAVIIWLLVILIWALSKKEIRASISDILKMFFQLKIFFPILASIFYIAVIVFLLFKIRLWNYLLIKDTVYWFFVTAVVLFINSNNVNQDDKFFKKLLLESFTFFIVLEFIINLYSFNLIIELILVPVVTFVVMMTAVSAAQKKYASVEKVMNYFLMAIGFYLLVFAISNMTNNFRGFLTINNLRTLVLPPILTISFLPFIYLIALWIKYEDVYLRIDLYLGKTDEMLARYAKQRIFRLCFLNIKKLNRFSKYVTSEIWQVNSRDDMADLIYRFNERFQ